MNLLFNNDEDHHLAKFNIYLNRPYRLEQTYNHHIF